MKSSPRAFTLIELIISLLFIAILAMALYSNFSRGVLKARFDDEVVAITDIIEEARGYSFTSVLIEDTEPTDYYLLSIETTGISLEAYATNASGTVSETIKEITFDTRFTIDAPESIYYFPPEGDICFQFIDAEDFDCDPDINEIDFTLADSTGTYDQTININVYGGYPELED
jgi:prepilin-type N-terminal cleavage/methylation domain-containing protein